MKQPELQNKSSRPAFMTARGVPAVIPRVVMNKGVAGQTYEHRPA